jgi:hypothetical protein
MTVLSVIESLLPLLFLFLLFQFLFLRLPRNYIFNLLKGAAIAIIGFILFLEGVYIGFLPAGEAIGATLGKISHKWALIPIGLFLGFLTTWTEPAVRILCDQVEKASAGNISKHIILSTICTGVAISIGLGMAKIIYGIPLQFIIIPGYTAAIIMLFFSDRRFLSIAFDAGAVATGPMAVTFLMAVAIGISSSIEGRDPIIHGFGLIALIALAPIVSVMALGFLYRIKPTEEE